MHRYAQPGGGDPNSCPPPRTHLAQCDDYLWLVYWNRGDGQLDTTPSPKFNPIPLESNAADTGLGSRRLGFTSSLHGVLDMDGDGLLDVLTRVSEVSNNGFVVFRGTGTGSFVPTSTGVPYLWLTPTNARTGRSDQAWVADFPLSQNGTGHVYGYAGVMDASGDGLPDLLFADDAPGADVVSYINLGDRARFSQDVDGPQSPVWLSQLSHSVTSNAISYDQGNSINQGNRAGWLSSLDFDADGRLDLYWRVDVDGDGDDEGDQGRLFAGDGAGDITASALLDPLDRDGVRQYLDAEATEFRVLRDYVDLNGDGVADYVEQGSGEFVFKSDADLLAGKPLRLLNRIDNGAGGITDIRYRASTDPAIDIPGTDDRIGMPTHTWVVDTITTTDVADSLNSTGTATGTTTYRYGSPVFNDERHTLENIGRYGFRGFEKVQVTSPLGAVTESVYDYSLDWTGRLVETTTYTGASEHAADTPDSIEQTTWTAYTLFCPGNAPATIDSTFRYYYCAADVDTRPAMSFQPVDRRNWTCADGQSKVDCLATAARRVETTTWLGQTAVGDDPDAGLELLFYPRVVWKKRGDAIQDGDRRYVNIQLLFSGADFYRLRLTSEQVYERVLGLDQQRALRIHFWGVDASGHDGAFETATRDHLESGATATTQKRNDLGLGIITRRRKPEQYQQDLELWTNVAYDATFPVLPTSTTNELGHVVTTDYDLGTGALLNQRGPNSVSCGTNCTESEGTRTEIDGFGRPLKVYAMTEDPADNTYREVLIQRFTYRDDLMPHRVVEERRIDWNGPDFTKSFTEFDGFGRVQERKEFRFESGKIDPIERFRYDAQGNIARVQVRDPAQDTATSVAYRYSFDALNRPTEVERPDGTRITWTYDGLAATRREVAATGPEAETTTTTDVFGRLVRVDERVDATTLATTLSRAPAS